MGFIKDVKKGFGLGVGGTVGYKVTEGAIGGTKKVIKFMVGGVCVLALTGALRAAWEDGDKLGPNNGSEIFSFSRIVTNSGKNIRDVFVWAVDSKFNDDSQTQQKCKNISSMISSGRPVSDDDINFFASMQNCPLRGK